MMKRTSLVDVAVENLKEYITEHQFKNGDKLPSEKMLIEQLGVSRTVVREAISRLQQSGLIQVKSGSGMFITDKNNHLSMLFESHMKVHGFKIKELLEVRKILELGAIRLIIENKIPIDATKLRNINEIYYNALEQSQKLAQYDSAFHETIILFTDNQTLITMSKVIKEYFDKNQFNQIVDKEDIEKSYKEHGEIIQAIESRDLSLAHAIINRHLSRVIEWIEELEQK
ncbi:MULTISPECIES: FadR/GntR family transcriptional regulator [Mammaliicoccus]|uniref:FadR family transcriptional regulator n=1 Tax=Mammaliicoccus fleurettii TaxID=150056 RepID=A0ABS5ML00_9STAP|nr:MULTISPECIES: FadR/GntR family transcriptional regulator [Mammaliicoccus]HCN61762.1 FadR family transcriptional regulator [Staphylococcus sp.]MBL0846382.1 FadR family transcriptional regulator [Mammaliicoccus fleurettii]MBO3061746.1 FadR family transcriptional regulator [Mammaliicoccus fleurettii]MBS3671458.1 FadR family transcriptional regulator [Mammaliicoccus fleurettii]MBS3696588.1 FadR family transcriptional regulator [Mammaliicoccus fleurettii]